MLLILVSSFSYGRPLTDLSVSEAYQKGKNLALHLETDKAEEYLKYAADKGNANAMVRYAYLSSTSRLFLSSNAYDYMLKAAKNGHEWAMISISQEMLTSIKDKKYWRTKFLEKMQPYISREDPDALYLMSELEQHDEDEKADWLIKAVDAGSCKATVKLSEFYDHDYGWFLTKDRRKNKIKKLVEKANQQGCIEGKIAYMSWLDYMKNYSKAWEIKKNLIEHGDANTIFNLGYYSIEKSSGGTYLLPNDYEKAAIYLKIYIDGFGNVSGLKDRYEGISYEINKAYNKLTVQQKQKVDSYVREYLSTHDIKVRDTIWETKFN